MLESKTIVVKKVDKRQHCQETSVFHHLREGNNNTPPDEGRRKLLVKFVNQMVASAFEISPERLLEHDRGNSKTTRARQISIYLMHTCLSLSLTCIAKIYGKDRTTIGHACRVIEDLRDTPAFDDRLIELEHTIQTVLALAMHDPIGVAGAARGAK